MADPQAATRTQLRNIQSKTGKTIAQLHAAVSATGLAKTGERRSWLMEQFKLGYGDANAVALFMGKPLPDLGEDSPASAPVAEGDPLEALYTGAKAALRPLHVAVMQAVDAIGPCEVAPKKSYVSLRRKKQFAMVGPATKDSVEIGFNAKDLKPHARLKALPPGGMCQATTRISSVAEVDATLKGWLQQAYDAAA
jgi:Domain of unknown function (DUF5655)/Domain of unknown function (DUF4287)